MQSDKSEYIRLCLDKSTPSQFDNVFQIPFPTKAAFELSKTTIIDALTWGTFHDILPLEYTFEAWNVILKIPANQYTIEVTNLHTQYMKCRAKAVKKFSVLKNRHYSTLSLKRSRESAHQIIIDFHYSLTNEEKEDVEELVRMLTFYGDVKKVLEEYKKNGEEDKKTGEEDKTTGEDK
jgi:hypothetical protein